MKNIVKTIIIDSSPRIIDFDIPEQNVVFMGVERGALKLADNKVKMVMALSDFDSIEKSELAYLKSVTNVIKLPEEKEFTDMEVAIKMVNSFGFKNVYIMADIARVDQLLVNIELIKKYDIQMFTQNAHLRRVSSKDSKIEIRKNNYKYISFFPITPDVTISTNGALIYALPSKLKASSTTTYVSNEIDGTTLSVKVKSGDVLIIQSSDPVFSDRSVY